MTLPDRTVSSSAIAPDHGMDLPAGSEWSSRFGGTRLLYGAGALAGLGTVARDLGARRVLLVTDAGVMGTGHAARAEASLRQHGAQVFVFHGVGENPTTRHVESGVAAARPVQVDLIVALGGGSVMDTAKGINFVLTNGGPMESYWGFGKADQPLLPSIGIPTTAGTGSDAQSYTLIEQEGTRRKMACGDEAARFAAVILDPDLTATCPPRVAAAAGLDAISHVVESWVSRARNPVSAMLGVEAWRLLSESFPLVLDARAGTPERGRMLLGSHLAGAAVEASMLGAAHAAANGLTARVETLAHGEAVLMMLPHVVRFNAPAAGDLYALLLQRGEENAAETLASLLEEWRAKGGLPSRLREAGIAREELHRLAEHASEQWTARFNPREVGRDDFEALYAAAW